jgi:V/A-type H+-transporting ATPase subunit I
MSILKVSKITLVGLAAERAGMLAGLQELGCVHLIALSGSRQEPEEQAGAPAEDAYKALRWIADVTQRRRQVQEDTHFDFDTIVQQALSNQQRVREAEDRRTFLQQRIEELTPWGSFRLPADAQELGGMRLWFYQVPVGKLKQVAQVECLCEEVHRDNRFSYIVMVAPEEPDPNLMPVPRTHTGAVPLDELKLELERTEILLEDLHAEHQALSHWIYLVSRNLARAEDRTALLAAERGVAVEDGMCVVQGWVAQKHLPRVEAFSQRQRIALISEDPVPEEIPPTLLENTPPVDGGQDLVSFYQTPGYADWDPSRIVFFSFALFFAMILADAGYALVLVLVLGRYWRRAGESEVGRRFRVLSLVVLGTSFVYGVLVGSYFGVTPAASSVLSTVKLLELNDFDTMMKLSILIGCAHLVVANGVVAARRGWFRDGARHLGWIAVIVGGLLVWIGDTGNEILVDGGYLLLAAGLVTILLFASARAVIDWRSAGLRLFDGLSALTQVPALFGDVLSYLRLFALGLASSSLAITFNQLAVQAQEGMPGAGLLVAGLIVLLGHTINLALAIISGFVHGLRLNFIEFFKWGLSDEGYPFRPFAKKEVRA